MFAWQIFDQKVTHLLRGEYRIPRITKEKADSFKALAERLEGVDPRLKKPLPEQPKPVYAVGSLEWEREQAAKESN
jgi:hypothetical protein